MNKHIYLHIPQPCHESWEQMTPAEKGRFCQSCAKQVVDFTLMSDRQVLDYITKAAGGVCGRFANDQLQRPLVPVKKEKKRVWWMAALMPLMLLFEKAGAQKKVIAMGKPAIIVRQPALGANQLVLTKEWRQNAVTCERAISGRVVDENGSPLQFASIALNGKYTGVFTDSSGIFDLILHSTPNTDSLEIDLIGYEPEKVRVSQNQEVYEITLKQSAKQLEPVVVSAVGYTSRHITVGLLFSVTVLKQTRDTLTSYVSNAAPFKIFPNPATRGTNITIDVKNAGLYTIQLFNNNGRLLQNKEFNAIEGGTQTSLPIPSSLAAGFYYVRIMDGKTKKQQTDKIVVM